MKKYACILYILEKWNMQCYVMASLLFQMTLVFLTPMRRWSNNAFLYLVIWGVYLLASFFSTFALSLIYNSAPKEESVYECAPKVGEYNKIFPFWAPFLLVHLGGPHTITALAMEDNNLWHRHLLTQMVQICSVLVVLYQYKIFQSEWLLPTGIVFLVGIVKCVERILSLQLASSRFVRKSIGKSLDSVASKELIRAEGKDMTDNIMNQYEIVRKAYECHQIFKGFIIDHSFLHDECGKEKDWFKNLNVEDAFKVMEMELSFMYDAMFTKMIAVQQWKGIASYFWCIWRFVCNALLVTVALIFFFHSKLHMKPGDIGVTYCLVGGAVLLDQMALIHLIFSHWAMVKIEMETVDTPVARKLKQKKTVDTPVARKLKQKKTVDTPVARKLKQKIISLIYYGHKLITVVNSKSWSGEIIQYSLLKHSLAGRRLKCADDFLEHFLLKGVIDSCLHTQTAKVEEKLKNLVFEDIKRREKAKEAAAEPEKETYHRQEVMDKIKKIHLAPKVVDSSSDDVVVSVDDDIENYANFVLTLHVATEICYFTADKTKGGDDEAGAKLLCIQISQYLAYLLVLEEKITSAVPGSIGMRFKDICKDQIKNTFDHLCDTFKSFNAPELQESKPQVQKQELQESKPQVQKQGILCWRQISRKKPCQRLLNGDYSSCNDKKELENKYKKSVLPKAVEVAREIMNTDPENNNTKQQQPQEFWKGLSEVWAGLLVYASSHCREDVYYLKKGGQFYTFVRLLMAHYGLQEILEGEKHSFPELSFFLNAKIGKPN
ncbi:PREDICTED: uncharacterized protein LOC109169291 isoform X2 [Ipomoea nil]|uniref:uncharacterized protein LOC109169291 isoform X2 n=1 Tax=Ipomoea nil TaxID=35883 RepID=UPI0009012B40|nr:PREDICTED: uncharacterized protein LOC109169291 isoform X2 [Ipomoea nil]